MSTTHGTEELAHELGALTADFPTLIVLPILLNAYVFTSERGDLRLSLQCSVFRRSDIAWGVSRDSAEPRSVRRPLDREC